MIETQYITRSATHVILDVIFVQPKGYGVAKNLGIQFRMELAEAPVLDKYLWREVANLSDTISSMITQKIQIKCIAK